MATQSNRLRDPESTVKEMDTAVNAGDIAGVMACFANDAVLVDAERKIHAGNPAIHDWFLPQMNRLRVESTDHRVAGDIVTWHGAVSGDGLGPMGVDSLEQTAEAVVRDGLIAKFTLTVIGQKR